MTIPSCCFWSSTTAAWEATLSCEKRMVLPLSRPDSRSRTERMISSIIITVFTEAKVLSSSPPVSVRLVTQRMQLTAPSKLSSTVTPLPSSDSTSCSSSASTSVKLSSTFPCRLSIGSLPTSIAASAAAVKMTELSVSPSLPAWQHSTSRSQLSALAICCALCLGNAAHCQPLPLVLRGQLHLLYQLLQHRLRLAVTQNHPAALDFTQLLDGRFVQVFRRRGAVDGQRHRVDAR